MSTFAAAPVNAPEILVLIFVCYGLASTIVCMHWRVSEESHYPTPSYGVFSPPTTRQLQNTPPKVHTKWCGPDLQIRCNYVSSIQRLICDLDQTLVPAKQPRPLVVVSPILKYLEFRLVLGVISKFHCCSPIATSRTGVVTLPVSETIFRRTTIRVSLAESLG